MNFLKALIFFIKFYKKGFFVSGNLHKDKDGVEWGFFRINHISEPAMVDIDFSYSQRDQFYFHLHGDDYRLEFNPDKSLRYRKVEKFHI